VGDGRSFRTCYDSPSGLAITRYRGAPWRTIPSILFVWSFYEES
jgi:hypothetical protein